MCTSINTYSRGSINRIESSDAIVVFGNDSTQFTQATKIYDGDFISVSFCRKTMNQEFETKDDLNGRILLNPTFDLAVDASRYKFEKSRINKINQNSESNNE